MTTLQEKTEKMGRLLNSLKTRVDKRRPLKVLIKETGYSDNRSILRAMRSLQRKGLIDSDYRVINQEWGIDLSGTTFNK